MKEIDEIFDDNEYPIIFTCSSHYNIFVSLCLIFRYNLLKKIFLVLFSSEKVVIDSFNKISKNLLNLGINNIVIYKNKIERLFGISDIKNAIVKKQIYRRLKINNKNFLLVNFAWTQQIVRYPASIFFKDCVRAYFFEEGVNQFVTPKEAAITIFLKKLYGNQAYFWDNKKLEHIFAQKTQYYPRRIQDKIVEYRLKDIYSTIPNEERKLIANSFFTTKINIETLKKCKVIIFSQPLSEDGYISESEKINVYIDIINFYKKYGKVAFKIHPRDESRYVIEDNDVFIVSGNYPSEVYDLLGIQFFAAIGICTSAVDTTNAIHRVNLNNKYLIEKTYKIINL